MTDKEIKEAIEILQDDIKEWDEYEEIPIILFEDRMAFEAGIKALNSILKIREYAEKTKNSKLREMLRLADVDCWEDMKTWIKENRNGGN